MMKLRVQLFWVMILLHWVVRSRRYETTLTLNVEGPITQGHSVFSKKNGILNFQSLTSSPEGPHRLWGTLSLLFSGYREVFSGGKGTGA